MKLITLYLPSLWIKALDDLVAAKFYPNRAEAIRSAVKDLLNEEAWNTLPKTPGISPLGFSPMSQAMNYESFTLPKTVKK